jgi:hypothetical protein
MWACLGVLFVCSLTGVHLRCFPCLIRDWMGKYVGHSTLALKPSTTDQVSQVLAYCSLRRLAVVPQGGNTGLVGGSVPVFDEIVLSLSSMNKIHSFDEVSLLTLNNQQWSSAPPPPPSKLQCLCHPSKAMTRCCRRANHHFT